MGRRSDFERVERDYYRTFDPVAVAPLLPHLSPATRFIEPCAGSGDLIRQLCAAGHECVEAYDIEPGEQPQSITIWRENALIKTPARYNYTFITNPPWTRSVLHPLIVHLSDLAPTWILLDANWAFTKQAAPYSNRLRKIVAIGRVKWIPDTKMAGKDDCCWLLFDRPDPTGTTQFFGRST